MAYLRLFALSAIVSFGLAWAWVIMMPMAFMDPEYPSWRAKQLMLKQCDLGDAIILGDSRAAVDIVPKRLPMRATNLAVGGGKAIEAYAALTRVLACPVLPKLAILSFDPSHFTSPDLFWERSVRFGFLSASDVNALRDASRRIGDMSVYETRHTDGLPSVLRDRLYLLSFPSYYAASLIHGGFVMRWPGNKVRLNEALAARGQYYFGTDAGSDVVAVEGSMAAFRPLPILDLYFDRLLALLEAHGIPSLFVAMPINDSTWQQVRPAMRDQFAAYLAGYERRYPLFRLAGDLMPHWPDRFFGDPFCHLNPEGAERFSALLAQRLQDAPPSTQNEAQKGWLSDTGRDASARVVPISKRGS
ncbi:MAG: hypothetical protein ACJ8AW_08430 [Rhodopila sp.]